MSPLSKQVMDASSGDGGDKLEVEGGLTPMQEFYCDGVVLITGSTGFLGKVLLEKLLRACPVDRILLLIRDKGDVKACDRLETIMDETILKGVSPKNRLKVAAVSGDCQLPNLGLSESDRLMLIHSVSIVFHVAATVRFDEDLATATGINVTGTKAMLDLAQDMTKLKAFVHVSTAYSQCHLERIEEQFYPPLLSPDKLIRLAENVERQYLDHLTPVLLKDTPNTYIYTKSIAEDLVRTYSKTLPISVFRPSIVVATVSEPVAGWIDNLYGPTGVVAATVTGVMRTLHCDPDKVADIVPADLAVNCLIATAYKTHLRHETIETAHLAPLVFNFVSAPEKPLRWSRFFTLGMRHRVPTIHAVWHPSLALCRSRSAHRIRHWLYHVLPAFIVDCAALAFGKRTNLMKITRKVNRFSELISYFATHEWVFDNSNVQALWTGLDPRDRRLFPFSLAQLDWENYFKIYMAGTRQYLLKDEPATIPKAIVRGNRFYWTHQAVKAFLLCYFARVLWRTIGSNVFRFVLTVISLSKALR